jgi:5-keto 4-deoxyuronate isomerase
MHVLKNKAPKETTKESVEHFSMNVSKEDLQHCYIIDSGATHHMTGNLTILDNYQQLPEESIYLANNSKINTSGKGTITIDHKNTKLTFSDVLYVPGLGKTIISVDQLIKKSYQFIFD